MPLEIRSGLPFSSLRKTRWLQVGACALVAIAWVRSIDPPATAPAGDVPVAATDAAAAPQAFGEASDSTPASAAFRSRAWPPADCRRWG